MAGKLTKREKTLLYLLLCLVITAGSICLLVLPALSRNSVLEDDLDNIRMQKQQMEIKRASLQKTLDHIAALEKEKSELYEDMFLTTDMTETLDAYVTLVAMSAGVRPSTLGIGAVEETIVQDYSPVEPAAGSASAKDEEGATKVMVAKLQITGTCTADDFERLADAFAAQKQLVISSASYEQSNNSDAGEFYLLLDIYLLDNG